MKLPESTEQQLPLLAVEEIPTGNLLYFGSAYSALLREARKAKPARRAACAWVPVVVQAVD